MVNKDRRIWTYLVSTLIFTLTLAAVIFFVQLRTNNIIDGLALKQSETANRSFADYLDELGSQVWQWAEIIAHDENIIDGLAGGDYGALSREVQILNPSVDVISICDRDGIVVYRSDERPVGDDVSLHMNIVKARATGGAATAVCIIPSTNSLAISTSVPVFGEGVLLGFINCSYDLSNNKYVDDFKARVGCETTVFLGDIRLSTTITDPSGERMVGRPAAAPIADTVLFDGQTAIVTLDLYGTVYAACYSPLVSDGAIIGMLFTGVDIDSVLDQQHELNVLMIIVAIIGVLVSSLYLVSMNNHIQKHALNMKRELEQQGIMASISRAFLSNADTDALITDTLRMIGEFMDIPQALLFTLEDEGRTLLCVNEYIDPKLSLDSRLGGKLPLVEPMLSRVMSLRPDIGADSCLNSNDPVIKEAMKPYRVNFHNYIATPVFIKGEMVAVVDFSRVDDGRDWSESEINLATLFASTLSSVFEREAMELQTSIVQNSPSPIVYTDRIGNLAYVNPATATITGYSVEEILAGGLALICDQETVELIKNDYIPNSFKGFVRHEIVIHCKNGRKRIVDFTSFDIKGDMVAAIGIDLTEIRALEEGLISAKDAAERASQAKSEFLSHMSHEIRTPINAITGMSNIGKNAGGDMERMAYCFARIEEASGHLLGVINDILDMSKIEYGKLELAPREFTFEKMLTKVINIISFRAEEKKQHIDVSVDKALPPSLIGDEQRLAQVISNLLSNAVKFTPEEGTLGVKAVLLGEKEGLCEIKISVSDSGIGISPEQQLILFQPFQQAERTTSRKFGGTGLGLAICKNIVEMMDGRIWIESELGEGATVAFIVKLKRGEETPTSDEATDESTQASIERFANYHVLLAEDVEINREIVVTLLEPYFASIDCAENGEQAVEMFSKNPDKYDLIFMDVQMPKMDGFEATRRIRALDAAKAKTIPIIAMTANVFKDDVEKCLEAGMSDHVGKPLDFDEIISKVNKNLKA
jgi:PAS domain S-box-containing protein